MGFFSSFFKQAGFGKNGNPHGYNEEFSSEMHEKAFDTDSLPSHPSYTDNGVTLHRAADSVKVAYRGLLARNGAENIYAVVGYGGNENWEDVKEYRMEKKEDAVFETELRAESAEDIHIAFRDAAGNWDNNAGINYTLDHYSPKGSH